LYSKEGAEDKISVLQLKQPLTYLKFFLGAVVGQRCLTVAIFFKSLIFEEWGKPDDTEHQTILNGQSLVIPIDDEGVE